MPRALALMVLAALAPPLAPTPAVDAGDPATADRVEEDWVLVIASTDPSLTCPQITMKMAPDADASSPAMLFNLNYRDHPDYAAGGLQVKILRKDETLAHVKRKSAQLQTDGENIAWTQRMSLAGGSLKYEVASGSSTTWGAFGTTQRPLVVSTQTALTRFANYSPENSVAQSAPSFGANRVSKMTLVQVRYYLNGELISTDSTPRPVDLSR